MKSIAFMTGTLGNGGSERVIVNLSNQLVQEGVDVSIITIYGSLQTYELSEKIAIYPIIVKSRVKPLRTIKRIGEISKVVKKIRPDVVISFLADVNIHVLLALSKMHIPIIVSERNDPRRSPSSIWMRRLRDRIYKRASGTVFQTKDAASYFLPFVPEKTPQTIIANPIKDDLPVYQGRPNETVFMTACRLHKQKNIPLMLGALKRVIDQGRQCRLDIYGEGPLKQELSDIITDLGISEYVKLRGFSKEIHDLMAKATAFVISSDYEGISNSMLEALGIGVPVIATDCPVGGARQYITNSINGYLVPCGDATALSGAMVDVIEHSEKAIAMGREAMKIRELISTQQITAEWLRFIDMVIKS